MANVLLVDDNGNVLLTLAIALRRFGHKVTVSSDPAQALNILKHQRFDFLISDVRMPHMSGIELAAQTKQLQHAPRIILTSAYSNVEAREGVAEAYLRKPIDVGQLHALLSDGQAGPPAAPNGTTTNGTTEVDAAPPSNAGSLFAIRRSRKLQGHGHFPDGVRALAT